MIHALVLFLSLIFFISNAMAGFINKDEVIEQFTIKSDCIYKQNFVKFVISYGGLYHGKTAYVLVNDINICKDLSNIVKSLGFSSVPESITRRSIEKDKITGMVLEKSYSFNMGGLCDRLIILSDEYFRKEKNRLKNKYFVEKFVYLFLLDENDKDPAETYRRILTPGPLKLEGLTGGYYPMYPNMVLKFYSLKNPSAYSIELARVLLYPEEGENILATINQIINQAEQAGVFKKACFPD